MVGLGRRTDGLIDLHVDAQNTVPRTLYPKRKAVAVTCQSFIYYLFSNFIDIKSSLRPFVLAL